MKYDKEHIEQEIWFSAIDKEQLSKYNKEAAYAAFRKRIANENNLKKKPSIRLWNWGMKIASVVLLLIVSYVSYRSGQDEVKSQFADIVVEAPRGARSEVILPDGTRVCLNAGSRMVYSQGFGYMDRLVKLDGEGYFEVVRNEQLSFQVKTNVLCVNVLGTKFDVRDYSTDDKATVLLTEGSVALQFPEQAECSKITLAPGQSVVYQKDSGIVSVENDDVYNGIEWTKGNLIFNGEPFDRIIEDLQRNYNVDIEVNDTNLYRLRFHGNFVRQEQSLKEVLDVLSATGRMHYTPKGNHVIIYK